MIKKNQQSNTKNKLLQKFSNDDNILQGLPFQIQQCYSVVQYDHQDSSYSSLDHYQSYNTCMRQSTITIPNKQISNPNFPSSTLPHKNPSQRITTQINNKPIQQIKALCGNCNIFQTIPKESEQFCCYSCHVVNKIGNCSGKVQKERVSAAAAGQENLVNKVFFCGHCSMKVKYAPGISQYIRCSKCNTVNLVPK